MPIYTSSKGTQEKWKKDDYFYKRDSFGGEAEAEYLVSQFLEACAISDYVSYEKIGPDLCRSKSFIPKEGRFLTMYRYLQQQGFSEREIEVHSKGLPEVQYEFLKAQLQKLGFTNEYLDYEFGRLFEIDRLTLNVDRHWNNFGIIFPKNGLPKLLTLFDFGYALGVAFPKTMPNHVIVRKSKAVTISKSFDKQCVFGKKFRFNIPDDFIVFLKGRGTRESELFLNRINKYYK